MSAKALDASVRGTKGWLGGGRLNWHVRSLQNEYLHCLKQRTLAFTPSSMKGAKTGPALDVGLPQDDLAEKTYLLE